ncbi:MAG: ABC-type transport system involved in resistance to organic solvent, permease component [Planctomycetota bacterium]|nr:ABC-type transport system involved in resistance to organic solvent, permease component [Planctomycetota bacterium]
MSIPANAERAVLRSRIAWLPLGRLADLGGIAILAVKALRALIRPSPNSPPLVPAVMGQMTWMLAMGIPLVGLVHLSFGSFLAMQAYFGATFTEGAGAVVGVGLIRNVAPLLSGFILAGLIAVKVTSDLRGGLRPGLDDRRSVPDRDVLQGARPDDRPRPDAGRVALARLLAAAISGPVLAAWGVAVGTTMGLLVTKSMLGQSPAIFLGKIAEMLRPVDVAGMVVKGAGFAAMAALISTFEGLRHDRDGGPDTYRAVFRSIFMILFLNFTWFNLVYLASDPFGPDVAAAPAG